MVVKWNGSVEEYIEFLEHENSIRRAVMDQTWTRSEPFIGRYDSSVRSKNSVSFRGTLVYKPHGIVVCSIHGEGGIRHYSKVVRCRYCENEYERLRRKLQRASAIGTRPERPCSRCGVPSTSTNGYCNPCHAANERKRRQNAKSSGKQ